MRSRIIFSLLTLTAAVSFGRTFLVDDDGAQCPGALKTIQEAVGKAANGDTILVCPGTYFKAVTLKGHDKDGLRLIALGEPDEVTLQGDHMEVDGFHLEEVDNVLVRGFTVRDFGMGPTVFVNGAVQSGMGNAIYLLNANYNVIENNRTVHNDMMGIYLTDSANNTIRYNYSAENDTGGSACGIMLDGAKSRGNFISQNISYRNGLAGLMIANAGPANIVFDNDLVGNGQWGIENRNTTDTWIEGNRVRYQTGRVGELARVANPAFCAAGPCSIGIHVRGSNNVTVIDNVIRGIPNTDLLWDGTGQIKFDINVCRTASQQGLCGQ